MPCFFGMTQYPWSLETISQVCFVSKALLHILAKFGSVIHTVLPVISPAYAIYNAMECSMLEFQAINNFHVRHVSSRAPPVLCVNFSSKFMAHELLFLYLASEQYCS